MSGGQKVHITERAVTKIVSAAVESVPGTISHSAGLDRLTGRAYPRYDIQLDEDGDAVSIETFIAVTWPSPILDVATAVRETVTQHVETYTGIPVVHVNVVVGPVVSSDRRITQNDLEVAPPKVVGVTAKPLHVRHVSTDVHPLPLRDIQIYPRFGGRK